MSNLTEIQPARVDRAAIALLLAYICLLPVSWSGLPFNVQWVDVLFPALLLCTIATRPSFQLARFDVVVLVYLASSLLSLLGTTGLQQGLVQFAKQGYLALLYAVMVMLTAKSVSLERMSRWMAGVAAVVATICVLAVAVYYVSGMAVPLLGVVMPLPYIGQFYRLYGAFPSPEYLVNFLAFATPLGILQLLRPDAVSHRRYWGIGLAMIIIAAIFTAGHGIVGLVAAATFSLARAWNNRHPRLIAGAVIGTVALFIVVNMLLVVAVRDLQVATSHDMTLESPAYPYAFHDEKVGAPQISLELTYNLMGYWVLKEIAWDAFLQKPLRGIGLGSFHDETRRAASEGRIPPEYREHDPHSTWLGRMAETGIIGTMTLVMLWFVMLRLAYGVVVAGGPQADVALALAAGLIAVLVNSPNVDVMNFRFIWLAFGALRGASIRV